MDYNLNNDFVSIKTSNIVKLFEVVSLLTEEGPIDLKINISADFNEIPEKYHEVFINILTAKYYGKVSFSDNPFSQCHLSKRKWWQFWIKKK